MVENHKEANKQFHTGHAVIEWLMLADCKDGKRAEYVGAPYCAYYANDMGFQEAPPNQPEKPNERILIEELDRIKESDESIRTVIPVDHFLDEHQQSHQRSQNPMRCSPSLPPPRRMMPLPIPFGQVITHAGKVDNSPERNGFEGYAL
jgi:hypothetical protein